MTSVVYQGNALPTKHCVIQYTLNAPPSAFLYMQPHTYTPLSPGMQIEIKTQATCGFLHNHWIIETVDFDGTQQTIHASHPIIGLTYEWGAQPFYQVSPLQLLQSLLSPLSINLQYDGHPQILFQKKPFFFKYQEESSLNFFNWLCALMQVHWAPQLDNQSIHLISATEQRNPAYQLTCDAGNCSFLQGETSIDSKIIQCTWLKTTPLPCITLQVSTTPIELGQQVHCRYDNREFSSIIQAVTLDVNWNNHEKGEIVQTLSLFPLTACDLPTHHSLHPRLMEAVTEGVDAPELDHKGKQSVRFLLDEATNQAARNQSPIETVAHFAHPESAFQAPIPPLNHVLTLSAINRQTNYLLGGLYQANTPSPQCTRSDQVNQLSFPEYYCLTIEQENEQTLTLQDIKNGLCLKLNYQPTLHCHLSNRQKDIYFSSHNHQCTTHGLTTLQAHQHILWKGETIQLQAQYYRSQCQNQMQITSDAFYQAAPLQQYHTATKLQAQSQRFQGQQDVWNLESAGSLQLQSNSTFSLEASRSIVFTTPCATLSLSAREISISSASLDFSSGLLTLLGKICFNQSVKNEKNMKLPNESGKNSDFTNLEKSRYDEEGDALIDAFVVTVQAMAST